MKERPVWATWLWEIKNLQSGEEADDVSLKQFKQVSRSVTWALSEDFNYSEFPWRGNTAL